MLPEETLHLEISPLARTALSPDSNTRREVQGGVHWPPAKGTAKRASYTPILLALFKFIRVIFLVCICA